MPWIILLIILAITGVALFLLSRYAKKLQDKQAMVSEQMKAMEQTLSMLVIDKKTLRLKDAGLPQVVVDQAPKLSRLSKVPVVKAKVGPRIMVLLCDPKIYDLIPVKKEVKAVVSGIYITNVKGLRTSLEKKPEKKKLGARIKGIFSRKKVD